MKITPVLAMLALFFGSSVALAQPYVQFAGHEGPVICSEFELNPYDDHIFKIAIANPDSIQKEITLVFSYYTVEGFGVPAPTLVYYNGIEEMFSPYGLIQFETETRGDTGFAIIDLEYHWALPGGLEISADTVPYFGLLFERIGFGQIVTFVLDSSSSAAYGDWHFSAGTAPSWSGAVDDYFVSKGFPNCGPVFLDPPSGTMTASVCSPIEIPLEASTCTMQPTVWGMAYGPEGAVLPTYGGIFSFQPTEDQVGQTFDVRVEVGDDWCWDGSYLRFTDYAEFSIEVVDCDPPHFTDGQPNVFVVTSTDELYFNPTIEDDDPVNDYVFSYYWDTQQDPEPPCELNSATGEWHYTGTPADTNIYQVFEVVTEGTVADTIRFDVYHFDSYLCGDLNHRGDINVSDLNWLASYLFQNGPNPVTLESGDVDCLAGVNVSDLTYLVGFLFQGGAAPCAGCPQ